MRKTIYLCDHCNRASEPSESDTAPSTWMIVSMRLATTSGKCGDSTSALLCSAKCRRAIVLKALDEADAAPK